jgi:hypothetical protein
MEEHITAEGLAQHTSVLASAEFEGRLPASEGEELTLRYLTTAFAQLGCTPAGDKQGPHTPHFLSLSLYILKIDK